jgi:ABC-2 type transport system ATP-binding protein
MTSNHTATFALAGAPRTVSASHGSCVAEWRHASKRFGSVLALDAISLTLRRGQVTALLGPNGAGKTTAVRLLLGLTRPTTGSVRLFDGAPHDIAIRQRVGAMLQVSRVPDTLTVTEHLRLFSSYYPAPRPLGELLALTGLQAEAQRRFGQLSGGQRQRLLFGIALCGNPELLVLDEPTVGMDVSARRSLWTAIRDCARAGNAVLLTTHYIEEADALADRVVVLRGGQLVADDSPSNLRASLGTRELRCTTTLPPGELASLPGVQAVRSGTAHACLQCDDTDAALRALLVADPSARDVEIVVPRLEEAFLSLTHSAETSPVDERKPS